MKEPLIATIPPELLSPSPLFIGAMESMDLYWWYWDNVNKLLKISPRLMKILGYAEQDFDPQIPTLDKNIHPDDAASNILEFNKLRKGIMEFYEIEYRIKVDNEWRWFYNRGSVVAKDDDGKVLVIGGVTMDMSGRYDRMVTRIEEGLKFEFVFKNTTQPVFVIDGSDKSDPRILLDMNDAAGRLISRSYEEVIGKDISEMLENVLGSNRSSILKELFSEGKIIFETGYTDRFGIPKFLEINAHLFNYTGKDLLIAVIYDNTESKLVKRDLQSSEMMFKSIFDNSTAGIFILKEDGRAELSNSTALEFTGTTAKFVYKKHIASILQMKKSEARNYLNLISSGEKRKIEFEQQCKFGDCNFWLWVTISGVRRDSGELKYFMVMIEDITERKKIENALADSENMYRKLIQSADDRIGLFDLQGKLLISNSAYSRALGFSPEEFLKVEELELIHPADRENLDNRSKTFFKKGVESAEYRIRHKEGHYLYMSAKVVFIGGEEEGKGYVLNIIRDVTEQKDFQKELVAAKEQAEESDQLKSAFLANMSHEIRTPMNSIVGFSNLLTDPEIDSESRDEYVKRINKNSDQLLALISDIIDLSKIESNQLTIAYSRISLAMLFNELYDYGNYHVNSRAKDHLVFELDAEPGSEEIIIESDMIRLTQILQNLINNAIKFTKEGRVSLGYRIISDNLIRFFVKDTGVGIDSENFDIIFDQFRQIDGSHTRRFGGTGLGLAICKNLAQMLGGKIWVESEKGSGTTFFLDLPIRAEFHLQENSTNEKDESIGSGKEMTIMMVDDDDDSLHLLSNLLRDESYKVILANSGYRALQMLETGKLPDIIFMDLQMPVLNGKHTMEIIRELYPELKVIAQSAYAFDGDKDKFIKMGFDDYFEKPFRKNEILNVLSRFNGDLGVKRF